MKGKLPTWNMEKIIAKLKTDGSLTVGSNQNVRSLVSRLNQHLDGRVSCEHINNREMMIVLN